jgi:acyl carrier protein
LNGVHINGTEFFSHEKPNRIPLPTYPFERKYYWIHDPGLKNHDVTTNEISAPPNPAGNDFMAAGETEKKVLQIWRDLLGYEEINMDDNFFELGGTSLAAMEIKKRIKTVFNIEIPVVKVLHYPTIRSFLENVLETKKEEEARENGPSPSGNQNQDNIQEALIDLLEKF